MLVLRESPQPVNGWAHHEPACAVNPWWWRSELTCKPNKHTGGFLCSSAPLLQARFCAYSPGSLGDAGPKVHADRTSRLRIGTVAGMI